MQYDPLNHNRRSTRLRGHDYSRAGIYFVTICTNGRECLFGEIINEEMRLNQTGKIVEEEWLKTTVIRREVQLDAYVIMPNHLHGIIVINARSENVSVGTHGRASRLSCNVGATRRVAPTETNPGSGPKPGSLGAIIGQFKSIAAKRINNNRGIPGGSVWQRSFHDHIIRNQADLQRIRKYIRDNPWNWRDDDENPQRNL